MYKRLSHCVTESLPLTFCVGLSLDPAAKWGIPAGEALVLFLTLFTVSTLGNVSLQTLMYIYGRKKELRNKNDKCIHCLTLLPE